MCSAAKEVDGTGTVDTTSNAAERLKLNQATSTTAGENSNQQVTIIEKKAWYRPLAGFFSPLSIHWLITPFYFPRHTSYPLFTTSFPFLFPASSCHWKVGSFSSLLFCYLLFPFLPSPYFSSVSLPLSCPFPSLAPDLALPCLALPCLPLPFLAFPFPSLLFSLYIFCLCTFCVVRFVRSLTQQIPMKMVSTKLAAEQIYLKKTWTPH